MIQFKKFTYIEKHTLDKPRTFTICEIVMKEQATIEKLWILS
jgi:hypothetical protein